MSGFQLAELIYSIRLSTNKGDDMLQKYIATVPSMLRERNYDTARVLLTQQDCNNFIQGVRAEGWGHWTRISRHTPGKFRHNVRKHAKMMISRTATVNSVGEIDNIKDAASISSIG